tara:strand:- start:680 stop:880 length:201 start_codon:yes stop_codon:yes gene_type:complete
MGKNKLPQNSRKKYPRSLDLTGFNRFRKFWYYVYEPHFGGEVPQQMSNSELSRLGVVATQLKTPTH